jgi:hypothetical protein
VSQSIIPDLRNYFIQHISLVGLLLLACYIWQIWWPPIKISNAMGRWANKAPWVLADVMIVTVAYGLATANELIIAYKREVFVIEIV